ncbi:MAG: SIS domain-containing protein [Firmicutes bacterium]|nr:SIS domain-containing protein [Bacillota bacterium]MDH7495144.1 SIS domain-containing protein [Bacillota bacterium]
MSAIAYFERIQEIAHSIRTHEMHNIGKAAGLMADSIGSGHLVHLFGSGHSVIPVMDVFPRYGSFVGFHPLLDPRLMWCNVVGPGGARELLWLERQEGYVATFLQSFEFHSQDTMWVFSHGGLNAAPVEAALYARERGLPVVAVVSGDNHRKARPTHSSGKKLGDLADVMIDTHVPLEDALVHVDGLDVPVAAGSTVAAVAISCAIVAEVAKLLAAAGIKPSTFVSPNVRGVDADHNKGVFQEYERRVPR